MTIFIEIKCVLAALENQITLDHFDPVLSREIDGCVSMLEAEGTP